MDNLFWRGPPGLKGSYEFVDRSPLLFSAVLFPFVPPPRSPFPFVYHLPSRSLGTRFPRSHPVDRRAFTLSKRRSDRYGGIFATILQNSNGYKKKKERWKTAVAENGKSRFRSKQSSIRKRCRNDQFEGWPFDYLADRVRRPGWESGGKLSTLIAANFHRISLGVGSRARDEQTSGNKRSRYGAFSGTLRVSFA